MKLGHALLEISIDVRLSGKITISQLKILKYVPNGFLEIDIEKVYIVNSAEKYVSNETGLS